MNEARFKSGDSVDLNQFAKEYALFLLVSGSINLESPEVRKVEDQEFKFYYSNVLVNSGISHLKFDEETILLTIDSNTIEMLLFDHAEVANCVLNCVEQFKFAS